MSLNSCFIQYQNKVRLWGFFHHKFDIPLWWLKVVSQQLYKVNMSDLNTFNFILMTFPKPSFMPDETEDNLK